jgi:hypothetical protein
MSAIHPVLADMLSCKCQIWMVSLFLTALGMAYCVTLPENSRVRCPMPLGC